MGRNRNPAVISMKIRPSYWLLIVFIFLQTISFSQENLWHGIERPIHYTPNGTDFLLANANRRFNRALYGGHTAFRVEAGDLPEFALYLPGMGGNLKFGLIKNSQSKWLIHASKIETRYRPGSMIYKISDDLLGKGSITLTVLALYEQEGLLVKLQANQVDKDVQLIAAYGGATGLKFSRDGDMGADPESSFYLKPEYCSDNVYSINKNQFTVFFGSKKPLTEEERYEIQNFPNQKKDSGSSSDLKCMVGIFPPSAHLKLSDANQQHSPPQLYQAFSSNSPAICSQLKLSNEPVYFLILNEKGSSLSYHDLPSLFKEAEKSREQLANRVKVVTPDPFINTMGGALSVAADAIWEDPSYLHGAVAWRMRLNGWRGAYCADVLGWHDRAEKHFSSYALSQLTTPVNGPVVMDTALHLARGLEKMGTSFFSSGYISRNPNGDLRPHHYDMNLVFVDELLNHFCWTGDTAYVKKMWPLLVRHLDWEKRNFDRDGDGLYDAYAAIWASDALQYSGGGVTHSSAYNYRSNKIAAQLAGIIGEDGTAYQKEADRILKAMNDQLWLKDKGWFAEYKDLLGEKLVHPSAGLWTVYHAIDSRVPDAFQSYQMLRYVDEEIPHIPVRAKGLKDSTLYTLSTTNWQPYTWSLNNVALAELLHTSLAYWQGGRREEAFRLWKSSLVESMYLGASPGNFQQLSFYDAMRGELYRDFADGIGMAARSLIEGLFGIEPDLLEKKLQIKPGFPGKWSYALLTTPDIDYSFKRNGNKDVYQFKTNFAKAVNLSLQVQARGDRIESVLVNGMKATWHFDSSAIGAPLLVVDGPASKNFFVEIEWKGEKLEAFTANKNYRWGEELKLKSETALFIDYFDPQKTLTKPIVRAHFFEAKINAAPGAKTFFLQVKQGAAKWWLPVCFTVVKQIPSATRSALSSRFEKVDLSAYFNDEVTDIFKNQYFSPRPHTTTLQLPTQGIGNWAYPLTTATIDDSGLRRRAGDKKEILIDNNIPFATPSQTGTKNIVFTSQWNNYPKEIAIPLNGKSSHAYFLMAGSTNPMQSRMTNGVIVMEYKDGTNDTLELRNPENWWPIEQDYYEDGYAFSTGAPKPIRVYLKTGEETGTFGNFITIKGFTNRGIDGGAATVLDMPLNPLKELKTLRLIALANDVVIGLMSVTLAR